MVIEVDSKGVVTATGNMSAFEAMSRKTGRASDDLAKKFGAFELIVKRLPGPLNAIASGMMGMMSPAAAALSALMDLTGAAVGFAKESVKAFSDFEMIKVNLETVMGSAEAASSTFGELRDMAARTPFGVEGLADAAVQLKQTGTAAKDLIPVLTMLGDTAGGSNEKFNRIVANFSQIQSVGKAASLDLKQFAMAGLPIYDTLKKMGVQGTATAEDIKKAFETMAGEGGVFFGAMARGAETLQGKTANLDDTWKTFKATFAEVTGLADLWKGALDFITEKVNNATEAIREAHEASEAQTRLDEGKGTGTDKYTVALYKLNQAEENYQQKLKENLMTEKQLLKLEEQKVEEVRKQGYTEEQIANMREAGLIRGVSEAKNLVEQYRAMLEPLERQNKLLQEARRQLDNAYAEADKNKIDMGSQVTLINDTYNNLEENKALAIQKEIDKYRALKTKTWRVNSTNSENGMKEFKDVGLSGESKKELDAIIASLEKQRAELTKSEEKLAEWQKIFRKAMDFSKADMGKEFFKERGTALDEYLKRLEEAESLNMQMARIFGDSLTPAIEESEEALKRLLTELTMADGTEVTVEIKQRVRQEYEAARQEAMKQRGDDALADMKEELRLAGLTMQDEAVARLGIERQITSEAAAALYAEQQRLEYIRNGRDLMKEMQDSVQDALENIRAGQGTGEDYWQVAKGQAAQSGLSLVQGTDVGDFGQGMMMGGPMMGLINMFVGALSRVIGGIEGLSNVLNPVTKLLEGLRPFFDGLIQVINSVLDPLLKVLTPIIRIFSQIVLVLNPVFRVLLVIGAILKKLEPILNMIVSVFNRVYNAIAGLIKFLTFGLVDLTVSTEELTDAQNSELQRIQALNDQYEKLKNAMKEQEEYYLRKRRELNADAIVAGITGVNDMIITPQGKFSTHPDDYIIATKWPGELGGGGGGTTVNILVKNEAGDVATATAQETTGEDGQTKYLILISKKVAADYAAGKNGWDGAVQSRDARLGGRRLSN